MANGEGSTEVVELHGIRWNGGASATRLEQYLRATRLGLGTAAEHMTVSLYSLVKAESSLQRHRRTSRAVRLQTTNINFKRHGDEL